MRYRVVLVVALAIMIFTITSSVLSGLLGAPASFAGKGDYVVLSTDAATIFSSRVDVGLVSSLLEQEQVTAAWAEVVSLSSWDGRSFLLRGIDLGSITSTDSPFHSLVGENPLPLEHAKAALVGSRLLERLGVETPYILPVMGSYSARVELVELVGSFTSGSYLDDEMLVHLDVARHLCGMPADMASVIGVETDDPEWLADVLSPADARFAMFDVRVSKPTVVKGEETAVSIEVTNWGSQGGDVRLLLEEDSVVLDEIVVALNASETRTVESPLSFEDLGAHTVVVRMTGNMPTESSVNVSVVEPYLVVVSPSRIVSGSTAEATVLTYDGVPLAGAIVGYSLGDDSGTVIADDDGRVELPATEEGYLTITASSPGYTGDSATVEVVNLSSYPDDFLPVVRSFTLSSTTVVEPDAVTGTAVVENTGAVAGSFDLTVLVDSSEHSTVSVSLDPVEVLSIPIVVDDMAVGSHSVQVGAFSHEVIVEPWYADEPDIMQLVIRYGGSGELSSSSSIPIYEAAKVSEGNIAVALFSIGAVSALLSILAVSAVFAKEVHEGRDTLGILRTLGASNAHIRKIVVSQSLVGGLIGALIGVVSGVAVAALLMRSGAFVIFSHEFAFEADIPLLALISVSAVTISVLSSLVSAEVAVRETPIAAMRKLDPVATAAEGDGPDTTDDG